jgi:hypothetical protein
MGSCGSVQIGGAALIRRDDPGRIGCNGQRSPSEVFAISESALHRQREMGAGPLLVSARGVVHPRRGRGVAPGLLCGWLCRYGRYGRTRAHVPYNQLRSASLKSQSLLCLIELATQLPFTRSRVGSISSTNESDSLGPRPPR